MLILPYIVQKVALPDRLPDTLAAYTFWSPLLLLLAVAADARCYCKYLSNNVLQGLHGLHGFRKRSFWGPCWLGFDVP